MDIKTEFNLKESAWFMKDNKPVNVTISAIETFNVGTNQDRIKYNGRDIFNSTSWLDHTNLHEGTLFKSKELLLTSLFGEATCKGKNCSAVKGKGHSDECIKEHKGCYSD